MDTTEKIITLARRYCIENFRFWTNRYSIENSGNNNPYSDNDYNIFPRYNVLDAILKGVETLVGQSFESIDQCKCELKIIGQENQTPFTTGKQNAIEKAAMLDERQKFITFLNEITSNIIENVEPLPYRRRLLEDEANQIRKELFKAWNFDGTYWEPLDSRSPHPVVFFNKGNLDKKDFEKIKQIIVDHNDRIYEITEERWDYEIDNSEFDPRCYETVYTNKTYDWIYYGSHENTVAFSGDWLKNEITKQLSDKSQFQNQW